MKTYSCASVGKRSIAGNDTWSEIGKHYKAMGRWATDERTKARKLSNIWNPVLISLSNCSG